MAQHIRNPVGSDDADDVGYELRRLLDLAETLQEQYEAAARRLTVYRLIEVFIAVAVLIGVTFAFTTSSTETSWVFAAGFLSTGAIYVVMIEYLIRRRVDERVRRDRRAVQQVVDLIREVEQTTAIEQRWSALERAEFRIRLSRFEA